MSPDLPAPRLLSQSGCGVAALGCLSSERVTSDLFLVPAHGRPGSGESLSPGQAAPPQSPFYEVQVLKSKGLC